MLSSTIQKQVVGMLQALGGDKVGGGGARRSGQFDSQPAARPSELRVALCDIVKLAPLLILTSQTHHLRLRVPPQPAGLLAPE